MVPKLLGVDKWRSRRKIIEVFARTLSNEDEIMEQVYENISRALTQTEPLI